MTVASAVAIVTDVHGNVAALDAVFEDLEGQGAEVVVFGGDHALHGPRPGEAIDRIRARGGLVIYGNTDEYITDGAHPKYHHPGVRWTRERLTGEQLGWLDSLSFSQRIRPLGGRAPRDDLLVVHATPTDAHALLILEEHPMAGWPVTPEPEALAMLGGARAGLIAFGHVHYASLGSVGGQRMVSVGAVGFSFDGDRRAAYALARWDDVSWVVEHRRVSYDWESVAEDLRASGSPTGEGAAARLVAARPLPL